MRLRGVHLGSLLVVTLALAGATVVPMRDVARSSAPIVWQAQDIRQARVSTVMGPRRFAINAGIAPVAKGSAQRSVSPPVRHALFQRPPPHHSSL